MSLKQRLLVLVLGAVTLIWFVAAVLTWHDAHHELNEVLDAHLAQASTLLIARLAGELDGEEDEEEYDEEDDEEDDREGRSSSRHKSDRGRDRRERNGEDEHGSGHDSLSHPYSRQVAFQVWSESEYGWVLKLSSPHAPTVALGAAKDGFSDSVIGGQRWRVFTTRTEDDDEAVWVQIAELADVREHLATGITRNLLLPLLAALPILAILLWWAVGASLRPLVDLTRAIASRKPDNLAPLSLKAPGEVLPLIERLNQLFVRTGDLIENERRFTADAAHELRTPIAAIRAQVQVAQGATQAGERHHALDNAVLGCQRATHLIEQLLTLARLEVGVQDAVLEPCNLHQLAEGVIAEMAPDALAQGIRLELDGDKVFIQGLPVLLAVLLRNLLDNAVRYTEAGTRVIVSVGQFEQRPCLSVCDNGAGLPADELEKITRRFYRSLGTEASGSGLGLSIVQRIAGLHESELQIRQGAEGRGLCVGVLFPAIACGLADS